jgi:hypothetical protein
VFEAVARREKLKAEMLDGEWQIEKRRKRAW